MCRLHQEDTRIDGYRLSSRPLCSGRAAVRSRFVSAGFILLIAVKTPFLSAQTPQGPAPATAVQKPIEQLIEQNQRLEQQNRQLMEQNRELMDQIKSLQPSPGKQGGSVQPAPAQNPPSPSQS